MNDYANNKSVNPLLRYGISYFGAYGIWLGLVLILWPVFNWGIDPPMFAGCCWCYAPMILLSFFLIPPAITGELILIQRYELRWWVHIPIMTLIYFALGFVITFPLAGGAGWILLFYLGPTGMGYWCILRMMDYARPFLNSFVPSAQPRQRCLNLSSDSAWFFAASQSR